MKRSDRLENGLYNLQNLVVETFGGSAIKAAAYIAGEGMSLDGEE